MNQKSTLQFRGGMFMSLIPVAIYTFSCIYLFVICRAFNMEALAVGGFLALLIGGIFCKSYQQFWEAAIEGISSITSISVVVILLMVGMFSALIKLCGLSNGFVWLANATGIHGALFVAFTFVATCIVSTATGSSTQQFNDGRPADIGGVVNSRLKYSLVASSITLTIYAIIGGIGGTYQGGKISAASSPAPLIMLVPVVVMLIVSVRTRNIYAGILTGLTLGTITGLLFKLFRFSDVFANHPSKNEVTGFLVDGINNILPTVALVISVFGIMGVLMRAGMLDYLADRILASRYGKTARGTELIAMLGISLITIMFGGVTSASILTAGPIVNKIGHARNIHPYRRANLLDGTANSLPAIIPFMSVFVFIGSAMTKLSPVIVAGGTIYAFCLFLTFLVAVLTGWGRRQEVPESVDKLDETVEI